MLKELFESCFYITFPTNTGRVVNLKETVYSGDFALVDSNACRNCQYVCSASIANRKQLLVRSDGQVSTMKIDDIFAPVSEDFGKMCDYILDDGCKMALIEMTCSSNEYVGSKRATCIKQLSNTLINLRACGPVKTHMECEQRREAIFSWKETSAEIDLSDPIEKSMRAMTDLGDEVYSSDNISRFDDEFVYREIRYPDPLRW